MLDHPWSSTVTGADRQFGALPAAAEAERDRYQLLLDINNAEVTCLGLGSLLRATSDSLRKVIPREDIPLLVSSFTPRQRSVRHGQAEARYERD